MGNMLPSGEKVVSGLVQKHGFLDFVSDNAGCFGSAPMPRNGRIISFGSHRVYVATTHVRRYPEKILVADDPPAMRRIKGKFPLHAAVCAETMVVGAAAGTGEAVPVEDETPTPPKRPSKPPLERGADPANDAGPSKKASPIAATIEKLAVPVGVSDNPA